VVGPPVLDTGSNGATRGPGTCKASQRVSSPDGDPGLVSVREVADQLGVHPETIRRLIHDGRLDAVRVGRVLRVHREAVDSFLARQRVKPTRFQA
jgi:excisionase family DNA binding protein